MRSAILGLIPVLSFGLPIAAIVVTYELMTPQWLRLTWLVLSPVIFIVGFLVVAGLISRAGLSAIKNGRIERTVKNWKYFKRRLHAGPWTMLYYFKPVYHLVLSIKPLRWLAFRLFGYKGDLDFTIYPDTWFRDLPVMKISSGAYLSNNSSIAPNICLMDGTILVDGIRVGKNSVVGHGALIGPGTRIGENSEIATKVTSGIRVRVGNDVKVHEVTGIQHGVVIEDGATIEAVSLLGLRSRIGKGVRVKEGSHIHSGVRLRTQQEADEYYSEETGALTRKRTLLSEQLEEALKGGRSGITLETVDPEKVASET